MQPKGSYSVFFVLSSHSYSRSAIRTFHLRQAHRSRSRAAVPRDRSNLSC